ncbi:MAG: GntR family transcriptional regulator [Spirochaetaceae bacterium]|jgi:GntR family transcriptional regulator|nr:GntR family transcriptional regulator [Spirochaetaceae bacterium]
MNRTHRSAAFTLDASGGVPLYRQIIQQVEYAVLSGRMRPGDRLPTIRSLAVALRINPNTIAKSYGELEIRGIIVTRVGKGTYISDAPPHQEDSRKLKIREVLGRFIHEMEILGVTKRELADMVRNW